MPPIIHDLSTLDGLQRYVGQSLLADIKQAYNLRSALHAFAVVIATEVDGRKTTVPHPLVIGHPNMPRGQLNESIKRTVHGTKATGCLLVQLHECQLKAGGQRRMITVQLEHREFGDSVWHATAKRSGLEGWVGPERTKDSLVQLKETAFLPERWMV